MAFNEITSTEVEAGKPVKESLFTKVKDNFNDHETRISSNETKVGSKILQSLSNVGLALSSSAGALTVDMTLSNGSTPSSANPAQINFRSSTQTVGTNQTVDITAALDLTIPSGATLGGSNGVLSRVYVYAINNGGVAELAVSNTFYNAEALVSTSALSAASDSSTVIYSTTSRANVPINVIGHIEITSATAGTWDTADVSLLHAGVYYVNKEEFSDVKNQSDDLVILTGLPSSSLDLGTFSGTTIADNRKIKDALQDIETAYENGKGRTITTATSVSSSTGSWTQVVGMSAAITKKLSSSGTSIRFLGQLLHNSNPNFSLRIKRGATVIKTYTGPIDASGFANQSSFIMLGPTNGSGYAPFEVKFLDVGGTGGAQTYSIEFIVTSGSNVTFLWRELEVFEI